MMPLYHSKITLSIPLNDQKVRLLSKNIRTPLKGALRVGQKQDYFTEIYNLLLLGKVNIFWLRKKGKPSRGVRGRRNPFLFGVIDSFYASNATDGEGQQREKKSVTRPTRATQPMGKG